MYIPGARSRLYQVEFRPVDVVVSLYLLANLALIGLFYERLPLYRSGLLGYTACLFFQFFIILFVPRNEKSLVSKLHGFLRDWYPYAMTGYLYPAIGTVSYAVFPEAFDSVLISFERAVFGSDISTTFAHDYSNVFFYESMNFFYFYFYFFAFTVSYFIYKKDKLALQRFYFVLMVMIALQFYFFTIFPTAGPKYAFSDVAGVGHLEPRGPFSWIMYHMLQGGEIPAGAFPSSHVSITLLSCLFAQRYLGIRVAWFFWFMFAGLVVSTVYTMQHYAVDPIGGIFFAFLMYKAGNRIYDQVLAGNHAPWALKMRSKPRN